MAELTEQIQPLKYQAFGTVEGILSLSKKDSTLLIGKTVFPVLGFVPKKVGKFHLPEQVQQFKVFPVALHAIYGETSYRCCPIDSILSSEGESDDCACAGSQMPTNLAIALSP